MLPVNTVHLSGMPNIARVAKNLGIVHAPAVVGFTFVRGKMVAKKDGIVVFSQDANLLQAAWSQTAIIEAEAQATQRHDRAVSHWQYLTKALLLRWVTSCTMNITVLSE
eukprot:m.183135 g.183135  ORF g.183135 m.183135 type:complete len:109 (+) comp14688_c0_seq2:1036-1362(+)